MIKRLACVLLFISIPIAHADEPIARDLVEKFDAANETFIASFRDLDDSDARLELVKKTSDEINQLFEASLKTPAIVGLLPRLETAKILYLEPTLLTIIDEHPSREVQARALLSFARYSGNNERLRTARTALGFLKKEHGDVRFGKTTFGEAADDALYFYTNLAVGCEAPPTVGEDADGAVFRLEDYRGKVVMLRFWGNWCPACRRMFPFERELIKELKNRPFALVGVNSDSREECKRAQRESNLNWRSVWDGGDTHGTVSKMYRVHNWPTIVIIDAKGIVRFRTEGLDKRQLKRVLNRLLKEVETPTEKVASREQVQFSANTRQPTTNR